LKTPYEASGRPALCRGAKPGQWSIIYKGATVWIDVFNFQENPAVVLSGDEPAVDPCGQELESFYQPAEINRGLITESTNGRVFLKLKNIDPYRGSFINN